jgi:hypothetical protein
MYTELFYLPGGVLLSYGDPALSIIGVGGLNGQFSHPIGQTPH